MKPPITAAVVQSFPLFAGFIRSEAEAVAALLEFMPLAVGDALFHQGDPSDSLFLLLSGEVEVTIHIPDHDDRRLVTLGPGNIIGEMGPLIDAPRAATVRALCDTHLACLSQQAVEAALEGNERWASKFLHAVARVIAQRLALLNGELVATLTRAEPERAPSARKAKAELAGLRDRLLKDWTF
jgi:CRP-like cAMP-binding protein